MAEDPYKYFRIEAKELLQELTRAALDLEKGAAPAQSIARLLRTAHTLKGAARVVKQPETAEHAHAIEEALDPFRDSADPVPVQCTETVLGLIDAIAARIDELPQPAGETRVDPAADGSSAQYTPAPAPTRTMIRAEVAEMDLLLDNVGEARARLGVLQSEFTKLDRVRDLAKVVASALSSTNGFQPGHRGATDWSRHARRAADELVESVATFDQSARADVDQLDRELSEIREAVERLRLVPARAAFTDLERAARDVAQAQGKQVMFAGEGGDVRLDAHLLTAAQGPLQQIVRNAVAHGIEPESERRRVGKPAAGRVVMSVARRGRSVIFTCRDDGRGIDLDAVRDVAQLKGLLAAGATNLSPSEVMRLLLRGGISTSGRVTELSGRGIGLDVVGNFATEFGGEVAVTTEAGRGTTIELVVPLALASFEALTVESGGTVALIPLDAVSQTLRVGPEAFASSAHGTTLTTDGRAIPFLELATALSPTLSRAPRRGPAPVIVVSAGSGLAAIGVDRLVGTSDVVVRPLPSFIVSSPLVSGVWLDAQGTPQLVLDAEGIATAARRSVANVVAEVAPTTLPPILVIDDSLTTRMLERSILESASYEVELASSAEEGLIKARAKPHALFLVDVEMPGIDGFTFIARTKSDPILRDTPAILVTSRNAPEDIQRGYDAGASGYVTKGDFDQGKLLARIKELTVH